MSYAVTRQIPPPPTLPTDWLPDYQRPAPVIYRPRKPLPGTPARGIKTGRKLGGKHSEKRRAQWRASKARASNAKADLAPASGAQVQRLVGQTDLQETKP